MDRDLQLLLDEARVLWGTDSRGRYAEPPLCAVAVCAAGHRVIIWPGLARDLSSPLRRLLGTAAQAHPAPGLRRALAPAAELLQAAGIPAAVRGGPSFLAEPPLAVPAGMSIMHSGRPDDAGRAAACKRPPGWDAQEWPALLGGQLGPWTMLALPGGQIVSICHTPRDSPAGAEAGTWTSPAFRGNGYAAATTAAWANLMRRRDDRPLFYSTADANSSSQRVAARLGLAAIGWIWALQAG